MDTTTTIPALNDATFDDAIAPGSGITAVEFGAEWCGPCKVMAPALEAVARELEGRVRFYTVDADENPRAGARFAVRALPTVLVFRDGELVDRIVGAQSRAGLRARMPV